jgi:sRNA-binding carbon storage regulator CsrA
MYIFKIANRSYLLKMIKRKAGQKLLMETSDGTIEVSVSAASLGEAKLEIDAPANVEVVREELVRGFKCTVH